MLHHRSAALLPLPSTSACAYAAWSLFEAFQGTWVWIVADPLALDRLMDDLQTLTPDNTSPALAFPAWDLLPTQGLAANPEVIGTRLQTLTTLHQSAQPRLVVASIQALMQRTLAAADLLNRSTDLETGGEHDPHALAEKLTEWGYEFTHQVDNAGQASLRGGLLDVWPVTADWPVRIEFFGNVIESMRTFDPIDQTSVDRIKHLTLSPSSEPGDAAAAFLDHLPETTHWAILAPDDVIEQAERYETTLGQLEEKPLHTPFAELLQSLRTRPGHRVFAGAVPVAWPQFEGELIETGIEAAESIPHLESDLFHPDVMEQNRARYVEDLIRQLAAGCRVRIFFDSEGVLERFSEKYLKGRAPPLPDLVPQPLSEGFAIPEANLLAVTESNIYGYRKTRGSRRKRRKDPLDTPRQPSLATWTELVPGELVVHANHGLGKYLGLYEIRFNNQLQEVLAIEYAASAKLYVPSSQAHLLSRYLGVGKTQPDLHRLGGKRWVNQKNAAQKAVEDLAALLLETQAARETLQGHAFAADSPWQHEFEQSFPHDETDDQLDAIRAIKRDMESARPMDRLICGDVGYGKTEVAMRAAFKAVMDGRQVAILVPTTVLAQQHFYTFSERMAAFPVTIEMLSRFRTRGEQRAIIERLKTGGVDIVIGTHRLVQADVQFSNLGLVIIDEEQRFGVAHKERLKHLRSLVDVLTLTATPIPRTLYMSLTGARDMSTIQTPPRERLAIETIVTHDDDNTIRAAILHEMNRNGQVFYLHNRVQTIQDMHLRLKRIVPEAWISVAHGQMSEHRLATIMRKFTEGRFHVLLCTTIIESGVDIPNVNTIIIDRADRFGLAELYQLRGRVGRSRNKAYAYLLLPRHKRLFDDARRRISAIKRYSSLGAGFKIALRDLEIRGAGNLLGPQQSGHIAAIGFDLYCQLLRQSVARQKGEIPPPIAHIDFHLDFIQLSPRLAGDAHAAAIPYDYIEEENQRVDLYRRLASTIHDAEIDALRAELRDRFGPPPDPVERLLLLARLRLAAARHAIQRIEVRDAKIMLMRNNEYLMRNNRFPRLAATGTTPRLEELLEHINRHLE